MAPDNQRKQAISKLHSSAIHMLRGAARADATSGLSRARLSALSVLYFSSPLSLSRLAEIEDVTAPTMSRLISGLEGEGLVTRSADANDGRSKMINISEAGKNRFESARQARLDYLSEQLSDLTDAEISELNRVATLLAERFSAHNRQNEAD